MIRARRIRRWLWRGAVITSLVMMVGVVFVLIASNLATDRYFGLNREFRSVEDGGQLIRIRGWGIGVKDSSMRYSWDAQLYDQRYDLPAQHPDRAGLPFWDPQKFRTSAKWIGVIRVSEMSYGPVPQPDYAHIQHRSYSVTVYYPLAFTAILPSLWLIQWFRSRPKRLPGHCSACGYNLTGTLAAGRRECPECGAEIEDSASRSQESGQRPISYWDANAYWKSGRCPHTFFAYPKSLADADDLPPDERARELLRELHLRGLRVGPFTNAPVDGTAYLACHQDDRSSVHDAIQDLGLTKYCSTRSEQLLTHAGRER